MRTSSSRRAIVAVFASAVTALALLSATPAQAASVRPLPLDSVVDAAAVAFQGRCLESRSEVDAATGLVVTLTTFEVEDRLKGEVGARHVIKQLGGQVGDLVRRVDGIPTFEPGERYVVFLYGVSAAGFSSPVGLSQGRFEVRAGEGGLQVANGRDFREMLSPISPADLPGVVRDKLAVPKARVEHLELETFKRLVRARVAR